MPAKALFSPFNEVIFRGISKYHPLKIANSLIFNELRLTDKWRICNYLIIKHLKILTLQNSSTPSNLPLLKRAEIKKSSI